jgi:hypothetical protein
MRHPVRMPKRMYRKFKNAAKKADKTLFLEGLSMLGSGFEGPQGTNNDGKTPDSKRKEPQVIQGLYPKALLTTNVSRLEEKQERPRSTEKTKKHRSGGAELQDIKETIREVKVKMEVINAELEFWDCDKAMNTGRNLDIEFDGTEQARGEDREVAARIKDLKAELYLWDLWLSIVEGL